MMLEKLALDAKEMYIIGIFFGCFNLLKALLLCQPLK